MRLNMKFHKEKIFKNDGKKKLKNGSYSVILSLIVIAVVMVINLIVSEIPSQYTQFDLSAAKLYTVSDDTKEYLNTLDQDVTIYYIAQSGQEDDTIDKLLTRYDDLSKHIKVEKKDPVLHPKFTSQYTDQELADNSVIVVCGEKSKVIDNGQMYESEVNYQTYSSSVTGFDGEGQVTSAIEYVTSDDLPILYTLEGHGELELSTTVTDAIAKQNVEVKTLNLMTEEQVPEDAESIMIATPTSDLSGEEADKIIDYLENGGHAIIFSDYSETAMPNFKRVLENYGVNTVDGVVLEGDSRNYGYQMPYYLLPNVNDSDVTANVIDSGKYVMMPIAQGIEKLDQVRDTLTITPILTTSNKAYSKTDIQNMENYEKSDEDAEGPFDIGMYITESIDDEKETKIIYYSSSSILNDNVNQMVSGGNLELVTESVSAVCKSGDEASVSIPSKSLQTDYLTLTNYNASFWMIISIIILPGLCLVCGLVIWMKRRKQ